MRHRHMYATPQAQEVGPEQLERAMRGSQAEIEGLVKPDESDEVEEASYAAWISAGDDAGLSEAQQANSKARTTGRRDAGV